MSRTKIEAKVVVQGRVERIDRRNVEPRGAVRDRAHDCFGGDIAAGARPILDDEWLAETLRQRLTDQACKEVRRAARRLADDQVHRPCRIGLRSCQAQHGCSATAPAVRCRKCRREDFTRSARRSRSARISPVTFGLCYLPVENFPLCAVQWLVSAVFGALPLSAAFRVAPTKHCLQPPQVMLQFLYNIVRK